MIPITKPCLGPEEVDAARRAIESGWVSQGPRVAEFEQAVADYCGVIVTRRRELAAKYTAALADHPWLRPPYMPADVEANFQSYAVHLTDDAPLGRDELMQKLLDRGIATRRGIMLAHREPAYSGFARGPELPCSERASDRSLLLPLYPQMTVEDLAQVVRALEDLASAWLLAFLLGTRIICSAVGRIVTDLKLGGVPQRYVGAAFHRVEHRLARL